MTFPKARLAVSACLFLAWLGFLLFLVIDARKVVLSQPQFLSAHLFVVVKVANGTPRAQVVVEQVLWPAGLDKLEGQVLELPELAVCTMDQGYHGAGQYLLPLLVVRGDAFQLAPVPRIDQLRIYPWTPDVRVQVEQIIASKKADVR